MRINLTLRNFATLDFERPAFQEESWPIENWTFFLGLEAREVLTWSTLIRLHMKLGIFPIGHLRVRGHMASRFEEALKECTDLPTCCR